MQFLYSFPEATFSLRGHKNNFVGRREMQSCYAATLVNCTWPTSSHLYPQQCLHIHHLHLAIRPTSLSFPNKQTRSQNNHSIAHCHTDICNRKELFLRVNRKELEKYETDEDKSYLHLYHTHSINSQFYSCTDSNSTCNKDPENQSCLEGEEKQRRGKRQLKRLRGHFLRMWWANLKAQLGQRINVEGIVSSAGVLVKEQHLVLPHVRVPNITHIDWEELHRRGFKGVVFDKDNTITVPYSLALWAPLGRSMEQCKSVFGKDIAVFSNSAGLLEYDHDGRKARILEKAIGIKVIRHRVKKPAGTADEIEEHFGCKSSKLIMVGDRPFTDIVYGNRNGFFTILTEPLSLDEEPFIVRQVRKVEASLVNYWSRRGLKPTCHKLFPDAVLCMKDPPPS